MNLKHLLTIGLITLTISCGKSKKEIDQEKVQIELTEKALLEKKEAERIHLEKIEVGKSKLKMNLTKEVERLEKALIEENIKLKNIRKFIFGRSSATKESQIIEQSRKIQEITNYISQLEKEISLTNLREVFEFQNTPEGVIEHVFESAKNKDLSKLRSLCDPYGENDGDSRGICLIAMQPIEMQNRFIENFENGRIIGNPLIENDIAIIEIAFGPSSNRIEKVNLIKRVDKWYITSL